MMCCELKLECMSFVSRHKCCFCWQVGGVEEYKIVEAIKSKRVTKPVVAWCIGTCARMFTSEVFAEIVYYL